MEKLNFKSVWLFFIQDFLSIFILELLILIPLFNVLLDLNIAIYFIITGFFVFNCFISYIIAYLTFYYFKFELSDSKILIQQGIIFKNYSYIPYDRIQNIEISMGVLDRALGLSSINIHTAGIGGVASAEGIISGIEKGRALVLVKELEKRQRNNTSGV